MITRAFSNTAAPPAPLAADDDGDSAGASATKRAFLEFSLCLSRACLGKKIAFTFDWLKKTVFSPGTRSSGIERVVSLFECSFPMSVPSLSW